MTSRFAVLGSPISHSKSPDIHNAAFAALGETHSYERHEVSELVEFISDLPADFKGLSLTMPLKEQALAISTSSDELARRTKAANTLVRTASGWHASNTDVFGIQQALAGFDFQEVCILGTGATARSAVVAMKQQGKHVAVWGRSPVKVAALAEEFGVAVAGELPQALQSEAVISTVVAGALDSQLSGRYSGVLLDVVYHPWPTKLAECYEPASVVSGLEMLIWQAIGQQRLFHDQPLSTPLANEESVVRAIRIALSMAK